MVVYLLKSPDAPTHLNASQWCAYYKAFAEHFDLVKDIEFNSSVVSVTRDEESGRWAVRVAGEDKPRLFDRAVVAQGAHTLAKAPEIEGVEAFEGRVLHGQAYKRHVSMMRLQLDIIH